MNEAIKVANKTLRKSSGKMVATYKDWHEMLLYTLHAYQIIVKTLTRATTYSLV